MMAETKFEKDFIGTQETKKYEAHDKMAMLFLTIWLIITM